VSGQCFTDYEGQIEILKSRGLIISDHQKAIEILSFENYYRLINGYKDLFLATTGFEFDGTPRPADRRKTCQATQIHLSAKYNRCLMIPPLEKDITTAGNPRK